jgi:hypothetical protein
MLSDRIAGAFTFKREVFAEVENDPSFTSTAWLIVIVVGFLNQLGAHAGQGVARWIIGAVLGTVGVVIGFAVAAFVISFVGKSVFNAQVTFEELVRTLGLAYVWNVIGFIGVLAGFSTALSCLLAPVLFLGAILGLVAWFVAAKEALDLEWLQTIITVVIGWIALLIVIAITSAILALLGIAAAGIGGVLSP